MISVLFREAVLKKQLDDLEPYMLGLTQLAVWIQAIQIKFKLTCNTGARKLLEPSVRAGVMVLGSLRHNRHPSASQVSPRKLHQSRIRYIGTDLHVHALTKGTFARAQVYLRCHQIRNAQDTKAHCAGDHGSSGPHGWSNVYTSLQLLPIRICDFPFNESSN